VRFTRCAPLVAVVVLAVAGTGCNGAKPVAETPTTAEPQGATTLKLIHSPVGPIVATGAGYALYDYTPDTSTTSNCVSASCVYEWPPYTVKGTPTLGPGLDPSLVGTIVRTGGQREVTYGGHPLYRWYNDTKPGMITGQAIYNQGGYWYVVNASGQQLTDRFTVSN
jgi:predicted lipoprotein with Yx(FWY)xxD motif